MGVFAFTNSPISRQRWDRNDMSIWQSCLHGSVCAPSWCFATAVPVGFMFLLWLVCTGTTDNSSMARKVVSKTGIENCSVYFDHILNAEWLSYQIQDTLSGMQYLKKNVNSSTTRTRYVLRSNANKTQLRTWAKTSVSVYNSLMFSHIW